MKIWSSKHGASKINELISEAQKLPASLGTKLYRKAIAEMQEVEGALERGSMLAELARQLPVELLAEIIPLAYDLGSGLYRGIIFEKIIERLPPNSDTLKLARSQPDIFIRTQLLILTANRFPEDHKEQILVEVIESAEQIKDEGERADFTLELIEYISANKVEKILDILNSIQSSSRKSEILLEVATNFLNHIEPEVQNRVIDQFLLTLPNADELSDFLQAGPKDLINKRVDDLIKSAKAISSQNQKAKVLTEIFQNLRPRNKQKILEEVVNEVRLADAYFSANLLIDIALELSDEEKNTLLEEALNITKQIPDNQKKIRLFKRLAPYMKADIKTILEEIVEREEKEEEEKYRRREIREARKNVVLSANSRPLSILQQILGRLSGNSSTDAPFPKKKKRK